VAANLNLNTDTGRAMLDGLIAQQAALIAYINDYKLLMILTLVVIPLVLLIGTAQRGPVAKTNELAHAID